MNFHPTLEIATILEKWAVQISAIKGKTCQLQFKKTNNNNNINEIYKKYLHL